MTIPRWIGVVTALAVCLLTFGGALGIWPGFAGHPRAALSAHPSGDVLLVPPGAEHGEHGGNATATQDIQRTPDSVAEGTESGHGQKQQATARPDRQPSGQQHSNQYSNQHSDHPSRHRVPALPSESGSGKRVVFDMSDQRVWLVSADNQVKRSYLVSGSIYDNLHPGTYSVYSKSRHAIAYNYKDTMQYMVRFTHGQNAAIGFHAIPVDHSGHKVQTRAQLGTPQSDGCIRQALDDAKALWRFAPVGTTVVVLA